MMPRACPVEAHAGSYKRRIAEQLWMPRACPVEATLQLWAAYRSNSWMPRACPWRLTLAAMGAYREQLSDPRLGVEVRAQRETPRVSPWHLLALFCFILARA